MNEYVRSTFLLPRLGTQNVSCESASVHGDDKQHHVRGKSCLPEKVLSE